MRRCKESRWDFGPKDGAVFPIILFPGEITGHGFCPAKLFRDDPGFILWIEKLFVAWKGGAVGSLEDACVEDVDALYCLIRTWETRTRARDFETLSHMFGGSKDGTKADEHKDRSDNRRPREG